MSHFVPAEDNLKSAAKSVIAVNRAAKRFNQMGALRANRRRLEEVTAIKNKRTLHNPGIVNNDDRHVGSVSDVDGVQHFAESTKGGQSIQDIPFMTEGLAYVLNNNNISTVAQLLAKFIELNDGVTEPLDICQRFLHWLNEITKGTIAEYGDVEINEGYKRSVKAKVAVTKIIAHCADERGLISDGWPEGNVYEFF